MNYKRTDTDMSKASAILLAASVWHLTTLFGKKLIPRFSVSSIHPFAYLIPFLTIATVLDVILKALRSSAEARLDFSNFWMPSSSATPDANSVASRTQLMSCPTAIRPSPT